MRGGLTTGCHAIMATDTVTCNPRMIDSRHWNPCGNRMTAIALKRCLDMIRTFASRNRVVVTTGTKPDDLIMIHRVSGNWHPGSWARQVAGITCIRGTDM